jgi:hypothetical protein
MDKFGLNIYTSDVDIIELPVNVRFAQDGL